jgi:hypothetical protein
MSQLMSGPANARFFGLDTGDWSVLLGGFALAALVLFSELANLFVCPRGTAAE